MLFEDILATKYFEDADKYKEQGNDYMHAWSLYHANEYAGNETQANYWFGIVQSLKDITDSTEEDF